MTANANLPARPYMAGRQPVGPVGAAVLALVAVLACLVAALVAVKVGNSAEKQSTGFYLIGFAAAGLCVVVGFLRASDPRRLVVLTVLLCFPYIARYLPPGRFEVSSFDVLASLALAATLLRNLWKPKAERFVFFPSKSLLVVQLLILPCIVFSQYPLNSLRSYGEMFLYYAFFLFLVEALRQPRGYELVLRFAALAAIIIALGIAAERLTGFNVAFAPKGKNAINPWATGRYSGFFTDAQAAGDYLAIFCSIAVTLVLRGNLARSLRLWLGVGLVLGFIGLLGTGSRAALGATIVSILLVLFVMNRWPPALKLAVGLGGVLVITMVVLFGSDLALSLLPHSVARRFLDTSADAKFRMGVWQSTWYMFEGHPFFGIGIGSFEQYLQDTRPVSTWMGLGMLNSVYAVLDQPESGYLKILYESGFIGVLSCLVLAFATVRRAIQVVRFGSPDAQADALAGLTGLIAFVLPFFTLFMLADERNAVILLLALALIWSRSFELDAQRQSRPARQRRPA